MYVPIIRLRRLKWEKVQPTGHRDKKFEFGLYMYLSKCPSWVLHCTALLRLPIQSMNLCEVKFKSEQPRIENSRPTSALQIVLAYVIIS